MESDLSRKKCGVRGTGLDHGLGRPPATDAALFVRKMDAESILELLRRKTDGYRAVAGL